MIAVIQRVKNASVEIEGRLQASIQNGLLILLGVTHADTQADVEWLSSKICGLRIFTDEEGKMNRSITENAGDLLVVSQFTLLASTQKGNRPSFIEAARPEVAIPLYEGFVKACEVKLTKPVATGVFGADMQVQLLNDGPVTIIIDTKNKQ
ncbi:MAG: D-aminoacyl-tRNA deacylase [Cytophaga sp.]|uniref:D-aminoacyl-tRNA deacylase n=1 Tax=Cytophaga sp. TaxID=29535 RepID=UPI003F7E548B